MLVYALHLHDTAVDGDPATRLTLSRLQKLCHKHELASPHTVAVFLGLMVVAGYLQRKRSKLDKRTVHLAPSAGFVATVERWNRIIVEAIDAIAPEGLLAQAHATQPRFGWDMRAHGAEVLLAGWKPLEPFPEVAHFLEAHGGWMLMTQCVAQTMRQGGGTAIVPVAIDLAGEARRFGGSRTHMRRLLEHAHANGLLQAAPRNGGDVHLSPRLLAAWLTAQASELATYRLAGLAARGAFAV